MVSTRALALEGSDQLGSHHSGDRSMRYSEAESASSFNFEFSHFQAAPEPCEFPMIIEVLCASKTKQYGPDGRLAREVMGCAIVPLHKLGHAHTDLQLSIFKPKVERCVSPIEKTNLASIAARLYALYLRTMGATFLQPLAAYHQPLIRTMWPGYDPKIVTGTK